MDLERDENGTVRVEAKGDLLLIKIDRPKYFCLLRSETSEEFDEVHTCLNIFEI